MNPLVSFLCPGYLQWNGGRRLQGGLWMLMAAIFMSMFVGSFIVDDVSGTTPIHSYMGNPIPPLDVLMRLMGLVLFGLSGFLALLDLHFNPLQMDANSPETQAAWQALMTDYLKGQHEQASALIDKQLRVQKCDPFLHLMKARLLARGGQRQKALKVIKICERYDTDGQLQWERQQLVQTIERSAG